MSIVQTADGFIGDVAKENGPIVGKTFQECQNYIASSNCRYTCSFITQTDPSNGEGYGIYPGQTFDDVCNEQKARLTRYGNFEACIATPRVDTNVTGESGSTSYFMGFSEAQIVQLTALSSGARQEALARRIRELLSA